MSAIGLNSSRTLFGLAVVALAAWPTPLFANPQSLPAELAVQASDAETILRLDSGEPFHRTVDAVTGARVIDVPNSTVKLVVWSEVAASGETTPFYAISLDGRSVVAVKPTSYFLKLRHGDFDPAVRVPPVETELAADETTRLFIVQFATQPLEEFRTAIEDLGGTVYHFLADHAYIVKMDAETQQRVAALPFVRWVAAA